MTTRRRTNQNHKASFSLCVIAHCSCGWKSATWMNKGAKSNATAEWHWHRDKCEAAEKTNVG